MKNFLTIFQILFSSWNVLKRMQRNVDHLYQFWGEGGQTGISRNTLLKDIILLLYIYIYTVFFLFNRYAKQRAFLLACTYLSFYSLSMCKLTLFHSLSMCKLTLLTIEKLAKCSIKWHILSPISTDCDRARKGSREGKTGTVLELSLGVSDPCKVCFYMRKIIGR